jgi:hypothetical protein
MAFLMVHRHHAVAQTVFRRTHRALKLDLMLSLRALQTTEANGLQNAPTLVRCPSCSFSPVVTCSVLVTVTGSFAGCFFSVNDGTFDGGSAFRAYAGTCPAGA